MPPPKAPDSATALDDDLEDALDIFEAKVRAQVPEVLRPAFDFNLEVGREFLGRAKAVARYRA